MHLALETPPSPDDFLGCFDQKDGQTGPTAQRRYSPAVLAECVADIMIKRYLVIVDVEAMED